MALVIAQQNRGRTFDVTIQDADGNTIVPQANDQVRIRIGLVGETDKLSIASDAPSDYGSTVTKGEKTRVRLDASDLLFDPGTYTLFIEYYDYDDVQEWKQVDRGVFLLEET